MNSAMGENISFLAFAETLKDVEDIIAGLALRNLSLGDISWVAVEIDAYIALREKNIVPIMPCDIISHEDRKRIFLDAIGWSKSWLDGLDIDDHNLVKDGMHRYFSYIFYMISVIDAAIINFHPDAVVFPPDSGEETVGLDHSREYCIGRIGKRIAEKYGVKYIEVPDSGHAVTGKRDTFYFSAGDKIYNGIFKMLARDAGLRKPVLSAEVKNKLKDKKILIIDGSASSPFWRLKLLCDFLNKETEARLYPLFDSGASHIPAAESPQNQDKTLHNIVYKDIEISDLCNRKISWILKKYLPEYRHEYLSMQKKIKEMKFDLLIGAAHSSDSPRANAAIRCFRDARIPALLIPHGVQFCRFKEDNEVKKSINFFYQHHYSHIAVVGQYIKENLAAAGEKEQNIRPTGNIEYFKMGNKSKMKRSVYASILGLSPRKKIIVYFLPRLTRDYHMEYVYVNFDETEKSVKDIMAVADKLDCHLVIKAHPAFLKAKKWLNCFAKDNKYKLFSSVKANPVLLLMADVVIVSRSSIAIEALDYENPVIIFEHGNQDLAPFEDVASHIKKYAEENNKPFIRATGYDELLGSCKQLLDDAAFVKLVKENCRRADPWVYHNRDGLQLSRIQDFISEIVSKK